VEPHLGAPAVQRVLVRDFNKLTYGKWRKPFTNAMRPFEFENCDWHASHRGRRPAYWEYVKHGACHWLCNFWLVTAEHVLPDRPWRIITSKEHSTVWDGDETLFDFNFQAFGIDPNECFVMANDEELPVGKHRKTYLAQYWRKDLAESQASGAPHIE
jgi:hypothetical protein